MLKVFPASILVAGGVEEMAVDSAALVVVGVCVEVTDGLGCESDASLVVGL